MRSTIVAHPYFLMSWIFAADQIYKRWPETEIIEISKDEQRPLDEIVPNPSEVDRLVLLRAPATLDSIRKFTGLKEIGLDGSLDEDVAKHVEEAGIKVYRQRSEGFWGESVAECALALTLCGLRRIPQLHHEIITSQKPWDYTFRTGPDGPERGGQYSDDRRFTSGTVEGKRVRVVGVGNIGSRYASFMSHLGADVAAWDPFAPEPGFHRAGARQVHHLDELVKDAEIFAPMVPLTKETTGLVTADHINALPKGCLVVLITRARVCDMETVRKRVIADEIALAADVHDTEPLPLDDPLLGRHNVVHTPHIAGRTKHAGDLWIDMLFDQFEPR